MRSVWSIGRRLGLALWLTACVTAPPATLIPSTPTFPPATATEPPSATPIPVASPAAPVTGLSTGTDGYPWWNDAVFYEVFVRSFYDSDRDGVGDLNGLIEKLDYLNDGDPATSDDLGITGLWLMPIHPSPSYHGYDVTDYYAVNPQYGSLDDFRRLLDEAHQRGIRVLIDWVPNHTSSQHLWFQAAQDPTSEYRDWYVWSADPPTGQGWHRTTAGDYYYGFFWEGMPDLNYTNPAVTAQMEDVARFWLQDVGVDGFRIDAIKYLIEDGAAIENTAPTHAWLRDFHQFYTNVNPQALTVGEVWDSSLRVKDYLAGDQLDLAFDFNLAQDFVIGASNRQASVALDTLRRDLGLFQPNQFASFLTNHDQNRIMSTLGGDVNRARAAAAMLLTSPGVPFIYYGEEIGMLGQKPDERIRTPMQWTAGASAGFTASTAPWEPVNVDSSAKNVAAQVGDPGSLLAWYRALISVRNAHAALRVGDTYVLEAGHPALYGLLRISEDEAALVLINLGKDVVSDYNLSLASGPLAGRYRMAPVLGGAPAIELSASAQGGLQSYRPLAEIPPYSAFIWQLQPAR